MIESLYVHIPFCIKKCMYCDFNSYSDFKLEDEYFDALIDELNTINCSSFSTIFVGGGTPTSVKTENMERLLKKLSEYNAKEYTFEANPGTVNYKKLRLMKDYGVNRISFGLQACQDNLLEKLGRIHKYEDFEYSYKTARDAGFKNINIDLMFAIPSQTIKDWEETLHTAASLKPEHISCYSLIVEEGTVFYDLYQKNILQLPDEDTEREMYYRAVEFLKRNGYKHYEISNFGMNDYECRHNITYWKDEAYIGVGAGAHSYVSNIRYSNYPKIADYIKAIKKKQPVCEKNIIGRLEEISEYMFLGLRMMDGITFNDFKKRFDTEMEDIYKNQILKAVSNGLLISDDKGIRLTPKGIDLSNQVFSEFILY